MSSDIIPTARPVAAPDDFPESHQAVCSDEQEGSSREQANDK
jgi:hypothetical protein